MKQSPLALLFEMELLYHPLIVMMMMMMMTYDVPPKYSKGRLPQPLIPHEIYWG